MFCLMVAGGAAVTGFSLFATAALFDSLDRIEHDARPTRTARLRLLDDEANDWAA